MKKLGVMLTLAILLYVNFVSLAFAQGSWALDSSFSAPSGEAFTCIEFVDASTVIIGGGRDRGRGVLYRWNFDTGSQQSVRFTASGTSISELAISHDTSYIMYSKSDGNVGSRYTSDLSWRAGFSTGFSSPAQLAFADPRYGYEILVAGGNIREWRTDWGDWDYDKTQLQVWNVATTNFRRLNKAAAGLHRARIPWIPALETSKYVNEFFVADGDDNADLFRTDGSHKVAYGDGDTHAIASALAFNWETDSDRLAIGYRDTKRSVRIYRYEDRAYLRHLTAGESIRGVLGLDFSPTDWNFLACVADRAVWVWDISLGGRGTIIHSNPGNTDLGRAVAFSPDGRTFASAHTKTVRIWRNTRGPAAPLANPLSDSPASVDFDRNTALLSNYPNPFNPETWIPYQLAKSAEVTVIIHSADGKLVRTLELGELPAGVYQDKARAAYWDGKNGRGEIVTSGVYFYTLKAGDFSATSKMLMQK